MRGDGHAVIAPVADAAAADIGLPADTGGNAASDLQDTAESQDLVMQPSSLIATARAAPGLPPHPTASPLRDPWLHAPQRPPQRA